jgi:hypothetical protein
MLTLTMEGRAALASGEPVRALDLLRRKHALVIQRFGEQSVFAATSGVDLGEALLGCGEYEEAGELLRWSAARYRELDTNDERAIRAMSAAAMAAYQAADYGSAEAQFKALIADLRSRGEDFEQRRAEEQDHLAQVLIRQQRYHEAEPLLVDTLSVFERAIGVMFPGGGDGDEPEQAARHAKPLLPKEHPQAIQQLIDAAFSAAMRQEYSRARATIKDATAAAVMAFGDGSPMARQVRATHIQVLRRHCSFLLGEPTGQLSPLQFMNMQMRAHMRRGQADGDDTPLDVPVGVRVEVCQLLEEALQIIDGFITEAVDQDGARKVGAGGSMSASGAHVGDVLEVIHYARLFGVLSPADACDKASVVMQLNTWQSAAKAFASAVDRDGWTPEASAKRDEHRALTLKYEALAGQMVQRALGREEASATIDDDDDPEEIARVHSRVAELSRELETDTARAGGMDAARVLSMSAIRACLQEGREAVVFYLVGTHAIFIVAMTSQRHTFVRVELEAGLLRAVCDSFRESMELDPSIGGAKPFDAEDSLSLYDLLIRPLEKVLGDVSHLFLVPDGPLWSISFEALLCDLDAVEVEEIAADLDEESGDDGFTRRHRRLRRAKALSASGDPCSAITRAEAWLGSRYSVSILPAVGVLGARGRARRRPRPSKPFLGFGNPLFARPSTADGALSDSAQDSADEAAGASVPLPQTERLLDQIARIVGADPELDVVVRADASVQRILDLNEAGELEDRRILCFATHALYPTADGDTLIEPGLVLAAADPGSPTVLSASHVRRLRLNADFVLLTACFTGAPAGKSITTPLSGLAQAFFTAGAKCLLVSHWPVDVHATEALVRAMFSGINEGESLAKALQRASRALRSDARRPEFCHPVYWAGFSIVGDGGAELWSA